MRNIFFRELFSLDIFRNLIENLRRLYVRYVLITSDTKVFARSRMRHMQMLIFFFRHGPYIFLHQTGMKRDTHAKLCIEEKLEGNISAALIKESTANIQTYIKKKTQYEYLRGDSQYKLVRTY